MVTELASHVTADTRILAHRESLNLDDGQGLTIVVDSGCLWITMANDPRDIVLTEGMQFTIDRPGLSIVTAEEDARIRVLAPKEKPRHWLSYSPRRSQGVPARTMRGPVPYF